MEITRWRHILRKSLLMSALAINLPGTPQCLFCSLVITSMSERESHVPQDCRAINKFRSMHSLENIECLLEVRNSLLVKPSGVSNESQTVQGHSRATS